MFDNDKEVFVDMIMDLLIIIDLDDVSQDARKEDRMRSELLNMSGKELGDKYDQAWRLLEKQQESERVSRILEEIKDIGVEAVKKKYGL